MIVERSGKPAIQLLGNRAGMFALASSLLWLHSNVFRREFLSLTLLPFVRAYEALSLQIHVLDEDTIGRSGHVKRLDHGVQFDWVLGEDDLRNLGLSFHHLASMEGHEYDLYSGADWDAEVEARIVSDASF